MIDSRRFHDLVNVIDDIMNTSSLDRMFEIPPLASGFELGFVGMFCSKIAIDLEHVGPFAGRFGMAESGEEIHHDNAAILFRQQQHVVGDVPGMVCDGLGGGV